MKMPMFLSSTNLHTWLFIQHLAMRILHHCRLSTASFTENDLFSESEECSDDEFASYTNNSSDEEIHTSLHEDSVHPGTVHRLDKGTSGLLVVAKNEQSHAHLSEQFKESAICRFYMSLTVSFPSPNSGRVAVPIAWDLNNRIQMAAVSDPSSYRSARHAASRRWGLWWNKEHGTISVMSENSCQKSW